MDRLTGGFLSIWLETIVDGLYRDGTVHISREMHKQCNSPRNDQPSAKTSQTSLTDLSLAIGTAY